MTDVKEDVFAYGAIIHLKCHLTSSAAQEQMAKCQGFA